METDGGILNQNAAKYRKIKSPEYEGLGVQILNVMVHYVLLQTTLYRIKAINLPPCIAKINSPS